MLQNSKAISNTFSLKKVSDFKCKIIENDFTGMLLHIDDNDVWVKLVGEFNAYNLLAVYSIAKLFKHRTKDILTAISMLNSAEGRFQSFKSNTGIVAVLDYAHTDDALKNVLSTINSIRKKNQKIITVFGCGGDRDRLKRPKMTSVACKLSSQVILTSDNPRSEDIAKIILDMTSELDDEYLNRTIIIHNRKQAIKTAFALAQNSDIVLIAGKGHEKYQEIEGDKNPFDDKEEILKLLNLN
jgi:UDP-N-acetylmuramoyl-L-alanyl-D-glutamate--2,6-diaminopimelate ligase